MIFGNLIYIATLIVNAIAILSEDRFLARIATLIVNAIAILSEDRFLARLGFSTSSTHDGAFGQGPDMSMKAKIVNLIASVRMVMRIPLIVINTLIIVYELVLG